MCLFCWAIITSTGSRTSRGVATQPRAAAVTTTRITAAAGLLNPLAPAPEATGRNTGFNLSFNSLLFDNFRGDAFEAALATRTLVLRTAGKEACDGTQG